MYFFLESTLTLENKTFLDLYRMPLKKTDEMTEFTGILCCQLDVPTQVAQDALQELQPQRQHNLGDFHLPPNHHIHTSMW